MIIELSEDEIQQMFKEYVEKHYVEKFRPQWIHYGSRGRIARHFISIHEDKDVSAKELNKKLSNGW